MRIEVGDACNRSVQNFKHAFTEFIEDITPTLVAVLPKIGKLAVDLAKNLDVLAAAALASRCGYRSSRSKGRSFESWNRGRTVPKDYYSGDCCGGRETKGMSAAVLVNPYVAAAAGVAALITAVVKYNNQQKELNDLLDEGKGSTQEMKDKIQEYEDSITKATNKIKGINGEQKATGRDANRLKKEVAELRASLKGSRALTK